MLTIEELRRMLENETEGLRVDMPAERVRGRARRLRRRRAIVVSATALVLVVAGGIYATSLRHAPADRVQPAQTGPTTVYFSDGTTVLARLDGSPDNALRAPIGLVVNHVLDELSHADGSPLRGRSWESIRNGAYAITTTIDPRAQQALEKAADAKADGSIMFGQPDNLQAAGAVVEPGTGRVLAYFGGSDGLGNDYAGFYQDEQGQTTGYGAHPAGSTFMAYTLAAALKAGYSLNSRWQWTPHEQAGRPATDPVRNASNCVSNRTGQTCSLLESTVTSLNVPYYDVTLSVGAGRVLEMARDAGIDHLWNNARQPVDLRTGDVNRLAGSDFDAMVGIGQYPATVLDQANAMATFAAGGLRAQAHFVRTVASAGRVVYAETLPRADQPRVLNADQLADLTFALRSTMGIAWLATKPGTWEFNQRLDQNGDAWSIGYTSALATAVWVGSKANDSPLVNRDGGTVWGSGLPTQMLRKVVNDAQAALGLTALPFPAPKFVGDTNPPGSASE